MTDNSTPSLRHSLLRSRIAKLPHLPAISPNASTIPPVIQEDEQYDGTEASGSSSNRAYQNQFSGGHFDPLSSADCFEQALEVEIDYNDEQNGQIKTANDGRVAGSSESNGQASTATFRVYYTPPKRQSGDMLDDDDGEEDTVFVFHHGAGFSALSFALVAKHITMQSKGKVGVLAFDCRGHGKTVHQNAKESQELSLTNLTRDALLLLAKIFPLKAKQPTLILVGHSMGGAVIVSIAHELSNRSAIMHVPRVAGIAVLDVVEGTAMAALPSMKTIVSALPRGFDSIQEAIRWHIDSGTIVNSSSARRSVPSLLRKNESYSGKTDDSNVIEAIEELQIDGDNAMQEDDKDHNANREQFRYIWRHDLLATEPFWSEWFEGLSQAFLSAKCARLLLLAGTDRLDKDLMIGQMQGKYQLVVFTDVGHCLQEDAPDRTAETLYEFYKRNECAITIKPVRKIGE